MKCVIQGLFSLLLVSAATAEQLFAQRPTAVKVGEGWRISFAAARATDVEVTVLDRAGRVVRHLAAGMLGKNAPDPLQKGTLKQDLVWDGKDDAGTTATGGPFSLRVSLGMRPKLQRFIANNPAGLGSVKALAVGPSGELFVFHCSMSIHPNDTSLTGTVFDRNGRYLRTIWPWPANLPESKLEGVRHLKLTDGSVVPFICQAETRSLLPGAAEIADQQAVCTSDGRVAFVGHQEWVGTTLRYNQVGLKQLIVLNADGSMPKGGPLRTVLATGSHCGSDLALSPDEKTIYAAGIHSGSGQKIKGRHAVYCFGWEDKEPRVFVGDPDTPGTGQKGLNAPTSVAVDKAGNVYVADKGNGRVVAFDAKGIFLGEIKVERPERVAVHRDSGAIYVLCGPDLDMIQKYSSWKNTAPVATTKVRCFKHPNYTALIAVDNSAAQPIVWLATSSNWAGFRVMRIEDKGNSFGPAEDLGKLSGIEEPAGFGVLGMAVDRKQEKMIIGEQIYDLIAGKWSEGLTKRNDGMKQGAGSFGWDGNFYSQSYPNHLTRYGPDLQMIPFPEGEGGRATGLGGSVRLRGRGVTADAKGYVYALWQKPAAGGDNATSGDANNLCVHSPDGKIVNQKLLSLIHI
ncbi:MAG: hypothetical protein N2255_03630, partial [Kiritimatiellae bacterium]|nr:hypothetical protein [Kiritimatiellia bacterium]